MLHVEKKISRIRFQIYKNNAVEISTTNIAFPSAEQPYTNRLMIAYGNLILCDRVEELILVHIFLSEMNMVKKRPLNDKPH